MASTRDSLKRLRKIDMYRKVPKDLTEGSVLGGLVSFVAIIVLVLLTVFEVRSLLRVEERTAILVDTSDNAQFRINVNITVFGLSCEFLSVDLKNALGAVREDLETATLHKYGTDASRAWKGSAVKKPEPVLHKYDIPAGSHDHYGNDQHALDISTREEFDQALEEHEVLLVDFHSPRCIHCVHFAPTYEAAAAKLNTTVQPSSRKYGVRLATLDCLEHIELCRENAIQAFPTVRVFRSTTANAAQQQQQQQTGGILGMFRSSGRAREQHTYEVYRGPREVDALVTFALRALDEVMALKKANNNAADPTQPPSSSSNEDSSHSATHAAGCRVEGFLDVARVPGSLIIRPHDADESHVFDLNLVNCDHRIDNLSFGSAAASPSSSRQFRGAEPGYAHVHFVSVVSRRQVLLSGEKTADAYEFAMTSDSFKPMPVAAAALTAETALVDKVAGVPHVEIMFDLSPMQILVSEHRTNWIEGITAMMALIGGVFSASFIIEGMLSTAVAWWFTHVAGK